MEGEVINLLKRVEEIKHVRDYTDSIWWCYISSDFSPCSNSFMWTLSFNFFQIRRLQKDVLSAAAVQAALPATSSSVPSQVPWALPTSKVPWALPPSKVSAKMPSCATSPTMPAEVPTQKQVEASAFIWSGKDEDNWLTQLHSSTFIFSLKPIMDTEEASPSFSLQYACGDSWQPEVSFLRLLFYSPLGGKLRNHPRASDGRAVAFLPGTIRGFSPSLISVCHLCMGFNQLVKCCLSSSSRINYNSFNSFVWWQKCFLSFQAAFSNTISSSCFVSILWCQGSSSHNQCCLNFESYQNFCLIITWWFEEQNICLSRFSIPLVKCRKKVYFHFKLLRNQYSMNVYNLVGTCQSHK